MANREWLVDNTQIYESGEEEYFVQGVQINEDQPLLNKLLTAAIAASGNVVAPLQLNKLALTAIIEASGNIVAPLQLNKLSLTAAIAASGNVAAPLQVVVKPGYEDNGGIATGTAFAVDVPYPATVNENDILIVSLLDADNDDFDTPSGWTQIFEYTTQANLSTAWYWKRATGSETGTETFTSTLNMGQLVAGIMYRFSNCITAGTPYEDATGFAPASANNFTVATITTTDTNRLAATFIVVEDDVSIATATGYFEESELSTAAGSDAAFGCQTQFKDLAGDVTGSSPSLGGTDNSSTLTLAFLPPVVAVSPLTATITANGNIAASIQLNKLALTSTVITSSNVVAPLQYTAALTADLTANGDVTAPLQLNKLALTTAIVTSGDITVDLSKSISFDSAIVASGDVVAPLQLNKLALTSTVIVSGDVGAVLLRTRNFTVSIIASGDVTTANLTTGGVQDLTADLTADGDISANIQLNKLALTTAIVTSGDIAATLSRIIFFDSAIVVSGDVTTANLTTGGLQSLTTDITADGDIAANIQLNKLALTVDIVTSGDITANLSRTISFASVIIVSGDITIANLATGGIQSLTTDITADGDITADIQLNKLALTVGIVTSGNIAANLSRTRTLTSALTGSGSLTGDLSVKVFLSVSLDSIGVLTTNLTRVRGIVVDISCIGSIDGLLNLTRAITADITVETIIEADLTRQSAISPWFFRQGAINKVLD